MMQRMHFDGLECRTNQMQRGCSALNFEPSSPRPKRQYIVDRLLATDSMTAYYNEIDPYAAQWLRNLIKAGHIAPGDVDERSIVDVRADDLRGYTQCHFFAGIGVWSHALRLAGWPDELAV